MTLIQLSQKLELTPFGYYRYWNDRYCYEWDKREADIMVVATYYLKGEALDMLQKKIKLPPEYVTLMLLK